MVEVKALLELLDLCRQRHRVGGVAIKDLDGDRAAIGSAEQTVDDLQRALAAVAAVTTLGERAAAPLHVARRDVVEHERAVGEMAFGQSGLDGGLALQQPVQRGVEFVFVDDAEAEHLAKARGGRCRRESAGGGKLGCRFEDPADQQRQDEIATTIAVGAEDTLKADPPRGAESGGNVAVRQTADDGECGALGGDDGPPFEHAAQTFDVGGGPIREIAERTLPDLTPLAVALAQEHGRGRVPVGDRFNIHGGA